MHARLTASPWTTRPPPRDPALDSGALPGVPVRNAPAGESADRSTGARVLEGVFGTALAPFDNSAVGANPPAARRFAAFADAVNERGDNRIWAKAHFRFASDEGLRIGTVVAAKTLRNVPPLDREAAARSGSSSPSALAATSRGTAASASADSGARPGPASPGGFARAGQARQGTGAGARWVSARAATGRKRWSPFP